MSTDNDLRTLLRLMSWLSPAFPVGSFGYSHGLEQVIADGLIYDADSLFAWLRALLDHGSGWNDAVLLAAAYRAQDRAACEAVADLARALCTSAERLRETRDQGAAFLAAAARWAEAAELGTPLPTEAPYPVAVAIAARASGIPLAQTLAAYLHAFASNLVIIAVRARPLGQSTGVSVIARLEPAILEAADRAMGSTLDDLGGAAMVSDIASMRHENMETRVFIT